jgi:hypothetical protein
MIEQPDLPQMMTKARELHAWYLALQEAGFNELQAYGLLQPMVLIGIIRREAD